MSELDTQELDQTQASAQTGDAGFEQAGEQGEVSKLSQLEASLAEMKELLASQASRYEQLETSLKPKPKALTTEEKQALMAQNPALAVEAIIEEKLGSINSKVETQLDKKYWDQKAQSEFPVKDPKFLSQLQKNWNDLVASGLDPGHPKAIYKAAELTARQVGGAAVKSDAKNFQSAEAGREFQAPKAKAKVSENDPRVRAYKMWNTDPKKIAEFQKELELKDAKRR